MCRLVLGPTQPPIEWVVDSIVCHTIGPYPIPKWVLHRVQYIASTCNFQSLLVSLRSSSSCLRLLPHLAITCIFPSITCFRRQFLHKMWPIQLASLLFIVCRMFLSSFTLYNTSSFLTQTGPNDFLHPSPAPGFKTFKVFLIFMKCCKFWHHVTLHSTCCWFLP
jgi:hypothetical protein